MNGTAAPNAFDGEKLCHAFYGLVNQLLRSCDDFVSCVTRPCFVRVSKVAHLSRTADRYDFDVGIVQRMDDAVRVVEGDGRGSRLETSSPQHEQGRLAAFLPVMLAIVVGLALGYLWGAARSTAVVPQERASALETLVDSDAGPVAPVLGATDGIEALTSRAEAAAVSGRDARLNELVPGFAGSLTWVRDDGDVVKWRAGAVFPRERDLPEGATGASWATRSVRLAYVCCRNSVLYAGAGELQPFAVGVATAAWHPTDMNLMAWLSQPDSGGAQQLIVGSFQTGETNVVAVLEAGVAPYEMVSWNDLGFALTETADDGAVTLVLLAAGGRETLRIPGVVLDRPKPDGSVVFRTGEDLDRWWVMPLDAAEPVALEGVPGRSAGALAWSPDGVSFVAIDPNGLAWLVRDGDSSRVISGDVVEVTWSGATDFIVGVDRLGRLVFYNLETGENTLVVLDEFPRSLEAH